MARDAARTASAGDVVYGRHDRQLTTAGDDRHRPRDQRPKDS